MNEQDSTGIGVHDGRRSVPSLWCSRYRPSTSITTSPTASSCSSADEVEQCIGPRSADLRPRPHQGQHRRFLWGGNDDLAAQLRQGTGAGVLVLCGITSFLAKIFRMMHLDQYFETVSSIESLQTQPVSE